MTDRFMILPPIKQNSLYLSSIVRKRLRQRKMVTTAGTSTSKMIWQNSQNLDEGKNLILALVCGTDDLGESEFAILDSNDISWLMFNNKSTITISRKKSEKAFRIANGGSREGAYPIKCNRYEELF